MKDIKAFIKLKLSKWLLLVCFVLKMCDYQVIAQDIINSKAEIIVTQNRIAVIEIVKNGLDLIVDDGIESAKEAITVAEELVPFFTMRGGKSKIDPGININIIGTEFVGGVVKEINNDGNKEVVGGFIEYGEKKSKLLEEIRADEVSIGQSCSYVGAGLLIRVDIYNNRYIDGSIRIGSCKVESDVESISSGIEDSLIYGYDSMYAGGHVGFGYSYRLISNFSMDINGKVLFMHQDENVLGKKLRFPGLETGKVRLGTSIEYKMLQQCHLYISFVYDSNVIGRKVEAISVSDVYLPETELEGERFSSQIGVRKDFGKFNVDCNLMKSVGNKEGIEAVLKVRLYFSKDNIRYIKDDAKNENNIEKEIEKNIYKL